MQAPQDQKIIEGATKDSRTSDGRFVPGVAQHPTKVFTRENQPSFSARSEGQKRRFASRDMYKELLGRSFTFDESNEKHRQRKQELIAVFGRANVEGRSSQELWALSMIYSGIMNGNPNAFAVFNNQAFGLPKQKLEHTGYEDGPIQTQDIGQAVIHQQLIIIENPNNDQQ